VLRRTKPDTIHAALFKWVREIACRPQVIGGDAISLSGHSEGISAIESPLNVTEIESQLQSINESLVREGVTIGPVFATMRDLVLKHGRSFVSKPLPNGRWQRGLGACYGNALKAASNSSSGSVPEGESSK